MIRKAAIAHLAAGIILGTIQLAREAWAKRGVSSKDAM